MVLLRISKKLHHPLPALTCTKVECAKLDTILLGAALLVMGINCSFNCKVVQGPSLYQGLEPDSIYLVQGGSHIEALQSHGKADTITGRLVQAVI